MAARRLIFNLAACVLLASSTSAAVSQQPDQVLQGFRVNCDHISWCQKLMARFHRAPQQAGKSISSSGVVKDLTPPSSLPSNGRTVSGYWPADYVTSWSLHGVSASNGNVLFSEVLAWGTQFAFFGFSAAFSTQVLDGSQTMGVRFIPSPSSSVPGNVAVVWLDPSEVDVSAAIKVISFFSSFGQFFVGGPNSSPFFGTYTPGTDVIEMSLNATGKAQLYVGGETVPRWQDDSTVPLPSRLRLGIGLLSVGDALFAAQWLVRTTTTSTTTTTKCGNSKVPCEEEKKMESPCDDQNDVHHERKWLDSFRVSMIPTSHVAVAICAGTLSFGLLVLGLVLWRRSSTGGHSSRTLLEDGALLEMDAEGSLAPTGAVSVQ